MANCCTYDRKRNSSTKEAAVADAVDTSLPVTYDQEVEVVDGVLDTAPGAFQGPPAQGLNRIRKLDSLLGNPTFWMRLSRGAPQGRRSQNLDRQEEHPNSPPECVFRPAIARFMDRKVRTQ